MHAVILAGGQGTRLRPLVRNLPKPLAPVAGRPFLAYVLDHLETHGFTSATLSIGYLGETICQAMGTRHGKMTLDYSIEADPLGTGGALSQALAAADNFPVFALNGDTYLEIDYGKMLQKHHEQGAGLTMAVRRIADTSRYGRVLVANGRIEGYQADQPGPGLISCGVYAFSQNLLAGWPAKFSFENDFLKRETERLRPAVFGTEGYFIDIGVPEDYARAQNELPKRAERL